MGAFDVVSISPEEEHSHRILWCFPLLDPVGMYLKEDSPVAKEKSLLLATFGGLTRIIVRVPRQVSIRWTIGDLGVIDTKTPGQKVYVTPL